jgi:hypothetical protein
LRDTTERLIELEQILARSKSATAVSREGEADPAGLHLAGVPSERIQRLTAELRASDGADDEISAIAARLLLNDYAAAVGHLRAVARLAVTRIEGAAAEIKSSEKAIRREHKMELKRSGAAAE